MATDNKPDGNPTEDRPSVRDRFGATTGAAIAGRADRTTPFSTSIEGLEGTGKSWFGLVTAPLPIVHLNFGDRDAVPIIDQLPADRVEKIILYNFYPESAKGWSRDEGTRSLSALKDIVEGELGKRRLAGGTFILDSGTSWWEVIQEVHVAPLMEAHADQKRMGGLDYMPGNLIVSGVVNWVKNQGAFVIITHRKAQEWGANGPINGKFKPQINRKIPYLVECRLDLHKYCAVCGSETCEINGHQGRRHTGIIKKLGSNTALEGLELDNPTFPMLYQLYTGRDLAS